MDIAEIYNNWNHLKIRLENSYRRPFFNAGEIWWCSLGRNIGSEIYGKGKAFARPAYILKKFGTTNALIIPITSKKKGGDYYRAINIGKIHGSLILSQARYISSKRLESRVATISEATRKNILERFNRLIGN